ncbi:MAG: hypothetical protein AV945_gp49 [Phormidium phage MIS-PhV1B]|jgi:hypothetical protein|uniref:hypothetical protein n=1 Tax=Phormidium phage MIS-PhV1B TaxID=1391456 RepID=UPI0003C9ACAA|nr:MAG: hypothetical protein AV945_gp49 [Phormidium phage MIS-PhV1B]YP_009220288.1 MAG: hypothetical protein AV945_gp49 [Phormidium phage MIS-PhV1A]AGZ61794.1 MAG: hypothetical protein [Phormidium phage MIS-PhV1A]AGZ61856.1 MAG: hypothetical protein [Phormidium phage MIS-PhV1B]HAT12597.1 hypothetical protein [Microcoleaceae cyanobacterium UBA11344]
MIKTAIGIVFGSICCLGLSIAPIPFQRWIIYRQVSGIGAIAFSSVGYAFSERNKEKQKTKDLWCFQQQQKQKKLEEAIEPVLAKEFVDKQNIRVKYSVADVEEEMKGNFTALQVERYGEDWLRSQLAEPISESLPKDEPLEVVKTVAEVITEPKSFAEKKKQLLKLIAEHEGGWIGQLMQKPLLIYGDMGAFKNYFASFLALCRHYLRGHQIVSIADPHFHQNREESWKCLIKLGVPGYGANQNYIAVGQQLNAMYDRFKVRTLKDKPLTSIWDEVTGYSSEEGTIESAKKLIRKVIGDPRKANESPILIGHDNTLVALGGSEGFSKSRDRGIIQLELYSDSENRPLFKGTLSGIKNGEGEFVDAQKVSIAPEWIRPEWVYELFNSPSNSPKIDELIAPSTTPDLVESAPKVDGLSAPLTTPDPTQGSGVESDADKLDRILNHPISDDYWLQEMSPELLNRAIEMRNTQMRQVSDFETSILEVADVDTIQDKVSQDSEIQRLVAEKFPESTEKALFDNILKYSETCRSASKIIKSCLKCSHSKTDSPRSYKNVGKPVFTYLVRKYGEASLIAQFADYLDKK